MNRVQTYRKETALKCRSLFPAADGEGNFGVQDALHPAVEFGRAGLAGGGEIGACHAAPQRDDAGAEDAQRPLHAQLDGLAAVGQEVAVLVDGPEAVGRSVRMGLWTVHSSRTLCTGSFTTVRTARPCHTASKR